jgi:hypothetical protein
MHENTTTAIIPAPRPESRSGAHEAALRGTGAQGERSEHLTHKT